MVPDRWSAVVLSLGVCVGLIGGAAVVGSSLREIRKGERYVTVKGAAERDVKADLALWPIKVRVAGNNLTEASRSMEETRRKVLSFLSEKGFGPEEIANQDLRVADRQASDFGPANLKDMLRYMLEATISIRSKDVDKVQKVSQMTDELVRAGVVLSSRNDWQGSGPKFIFSELNKVKPALMAEATKNAREAATQFASDSGSKVGAIRKASQGVVTISDRDQPSSSRDEGGGGPFSEASDPNKRVRVVVTVDYYLDL